MAALCRLLSCCGCLVWFLPVRCSRTNFPLPHRTSARSQTRCIYSRRHRVAVCFYYYYYYFLKSFASRSFKPSLILISCSHTPESSHQLIVQQLDRSIIAFWGRKAWLKWMQRHKFCILIFFFFKHGWGVWRMNEFCSSKEFLFLFLSLSQLSPVSVSINR